MSKGEVKTVPRRLYVDEKFLSAYLTRKECDAWHSYASVSDTLRMDALLGLARMRESSFKKSFRGIEAARPE